MAFWTPFLVGLGTQAAAALVWPSWKWWKRYLASLPVTVGIIVAGYYL